MKRITVRKGKKIFHLFSEEGKSLYDLLVENNISLNAFCGGKGTCGKCKVIIKEEYNTEEMKKHLSDFEIENGVKLACMVKIDKDLDVEILEDTKNHIISKEIYNNNIVVNHSIKAHRFKLNKPTIENQVSLLTLVKERFGKNISVSINILKKLYDFLEKECFLVIDEKHNELLDIKEDKNVYGTAIDIGTTTVVIYLIDMQEGRIIDTYAFLNPQKKFGADVISRIEFCMKNQNGVDILKKEIMDSLNTGIVKLCSNNGILKDEIYKAVIVGNPTMLHILLGVNPEGIALAPFIPTFTDALFYSAYQIGFNIHPNAQICLMDSISAYVGADIYAGIIATDMHNDFKYNLLIDLGTNGEMVLGNKDMLYCCSTAAGPAFEGANLSCGMNASNGAVDNCIIENGKIKYTTIGNEKPIGICGSGIVSLIAQMIEKEVIDYSGRFNEQFMTLHKNLFREINGQQCFLISDNVYVSQKDIREIQLAKSAILSGIMVMLEKANIDLSQISNVYLAGGFGNYINPSDAATVGIIPKELVEKVKVVGNSAGNGAVLVLLNDEISQFANIKDKINYIELSNSSQFNNYFIEHMFFE